MENTEQTPEPKFICFYKSYSDVFVGMTDAQAGKMIKAMCNYFFSGVEPDFKGISGAMFTFIRCQMDSDRRRYDGICERNRSNSRKRRKKTEEQPA